MKIKKQILISDVSLASWQQEVNEHLEAGWTVVPDALKVITSSHIIVFVAVLEREEEE